MYYVPNHDRPDSRPPVKGEMFVDLPGPAPVPERSMLDQTWKTILTYDPLLDSDEESPDENARVEYARRLSVIRRLRGRSPTPEPDDDGVPLGRFTQVIEWD